MKLDISKTLYWKIVIETLNLVAKDISFRMERQIFEELYLLNGNKVVMIE